MFDAHLHYLDFFQRSDGMDSFVHAMAMAGVTGAMICGCSLKKHWSEYEERMAPNAISDTDVLQYFSLTDGARASFFVSHVTSHRAPRSVTPRARTRRWRGGAACCVCVNRVAQVHRFEDTTPPHPSSPDAPAASGSISILRACVCCCRARGTGTVRSALESSKPSVADMFVPSLCGFDPTDRLAVEQITQLLDFGIGPRLGWGAIGEVRR